MSSAFSVKLLSLLFFLTRQIKYLANNKYTGILLDKQLISFQERFVEFLYLGKGLGTYINSRNLTLGLLILFVCDVTSVLFVIYGLISQW